MTKLLGVALAALSTINIMAQTVTFQSLSSPSARVSVITPESRGFTAAIQSLVEPAVLPLIEGILPFCYVLTNSSDKFIIAYSTRWTLIDSSGQATFQDRTWWNLTTLRGGDAIAPGASKFVSPIFRLGVPNVGPTGSALSRELQRMVSAFATKKSVVASLETVIFEDGSAFGTDATNAVAQAQAHLDGERRLSDLISRVTAAQGDVTKALNSLVPSPSGPRTYVSSNPPQYDERVVQRQQSLASLLVRMTPDQLEAFKQRVAKNRNLNIVKQ